MKRSHTTIFFHLIFALLLLSACEDQGTTDGDSKQKPEPQINLAEDPDDSPSGTCYSDQPVDSSTVHDWKQTWMSTSREAGLICGDQNGDGGKWFHANLVVQLLNSCEECPAVRAYFGFVNEGDSCPVTMLTMVDDNCNDSLSGEKPVLLRELGSSSWITQEDASQYANNWINTISGNADFNDFMLVQHYTYERQSFATLLSDTIHYPEYNTDDYMTMISLTMAQHDIGCDPGALTAGENCLTGDTTQVMDMVLELLYYHKDDGGNHFHPPVERINFARPCPNHCLGNSLAN